MLLTSSTPLPLLPGGAGDPPAGGAEPPAGSGFQPLLAGLIRQLGTAPAAAGPQPALAGGEGGAGNPLPPGGVPLPLPSLMEPAAAVPGAADAAAGAPAAGMLEAGEPIAVGLVTGEGEAVNESASMMEQLAGLPPSPAAASRTAAAMSEADTALSEDAEGEEPPPESGTGLLFAPVTPAPLAAPATGPAPTPVVEGAVKRLLPMADKATAVPSQAMAAEGEAGAPPTLEARGAAAAPLPAMVETLAEIDGAAVDELVTAATTATAAAPSRDSGARLYQGLVTTQTQVDVPVGKPGWSSAVVDKLMWFSAQQISSAEIHLNPAELGPLSVRIATHQEQATVYFTSHHATVREALDQALPRLREMFESQGMQLLDAGVGDQQARQQAGTRRDMAGNPGGLPHGGDEAEAGEGAGRQVAVRLPLGLVDAYA